MSAFPFDFMDDIIAWIWSYLIPILGILLLIGSIVVISWFLRRFRTLDRETYDDYVRRIIAGLAGGTVVFLATRFETLGKLDIITGIANILLIFLLAVFILFLGAFIHFRLGRPQGVVHRQPVNANYSPKHKNWAIGFVIFIIVIIALLGISLWNNNQVWIWTALSAIGTLSLALLVVYKDFISQPIIDAEFEQNEPFCGAALTPIILTGTPGQTTPTTNGYWIRIRVINRGKIAANNCEGRLVEIRHSNGSMFQPFDPVVLHWVGRRDFNRININSQDYEYLDVIYTLNGNNEAIINCEESRPIGTLPPRGIRTSLPSGSYIIKVSISSGNAKSISKNYSVEWNGIWNEIIMREV